MLEQIILGIIQGIVEWLPVSSEGVILLVIKNFFDAEAGAETIIRQALFLHLGTFFAALVYFRKDVVLLFKALFKYKSASLKTKKIFNFLLAATLISGFLGFILLKVFIELEEQLFLSAKAITIAVGLLLLVTGWLQIKAKKDGGKKIRGLSRKDGVFLGLAQGFAALPGLSRSGLTVSVLLLRKFKSESALKLSFLMSLPIVLFGNIFLNLNNFAFSSKVAIGLLFAFLFGILTIDLLLKAARKFEFGWFVLVFGFLVIFSAMV
ncbi:MAG: undecaprenyl-diphosphate phosphatase [Patescibacteria group bacterium]|nr:undecaprenyl-diphosphate phosphatase [Patescibacteria group bacterium]